MPVRQPPVTAPAVRVLLDSIVDYAGLFPPASVSMAVAVRNFAHYRASDHGWMLGRFICPAAGLELFARDAELYLPRDAGAIPWRLSVTSSGDIEKDMQAIARFNEHHRVCFDECSAIVDAYEAKVTDARHVQQVHQQITMPVRTFLEVPLSGDPTPLVEAIARTGRGAKVRTGGVTADAIPPSESVARFLIACAHTGVVAKATAGLHHPLRDAYRLTYEEGAEQAVMFGYINVFLATALVGAGAPLRDVVSMLEERNAEHITFDATHCYWSGGTKPYALERAFLAQMRDRGLVSFGSCSFTEPVQETHALGWL